MKGVKFFSLIAMIWSTAAFARVGSIRPIFCEKPYLSLFIFFIAAVVYRVIDEFE